MYKKAASCTSILSSLTQNNTDLCAQLHDPCDVTQGLLIKCQELYKHNLNIQSVCSAQVWFYTRHSYEYPFITFMFHYLTQCHIIVGLNVFTSDLYTSSFHVTFTVFCATPPKASILTLQCRFTWEHVHMRVHTCTHAHKQTNKQTNKQTHTHTHTYIYRVSREECARLRENVP